MTLYTHLKVLRKVPVEDALNFMCSCELIVDVSNAECGNSFHLIWVKNWYLVSLLVRARSILGLLNRKISEGELV
jgi:hypothetical protein